MEYNDSFIIVQIDDNEFVIMENGFLWDQCVVPFTNHRQASTAIARERLIRVLKEKRRHLNFS